MLITNLENVPGQRVMKSLGLVRGHALQQGSRMAQLLAGVQRLLGGELGHYSTLLRRSREKALQRMEVEARAKGANAILNVRFSALAVVRGRAELSVLGTAVVLE